MWFIIGVALAEEGEVCASFGGAETPVEILSDLLPKVESSGLTASWRDPGLFYTHDDQDGATSLYLFRETGEYVGAQAVQGATNTDWEDIATGPCPASVTGDSCLWIGDIGDNDELRPNVTLWVLAETEEAVATAVACPLVYPNGRSRNAEAMVVTPEGIVRIFTKDKDGAKVFRLDEPACDGGAAQTLVEEGEIPSAVSLTGAALSPDGRSLVLRNLTDAWLFTGCVFNWTSDPVPVDLGTQPQGEAVAFTLDGDLLSTSEVIDTEPLRYWRTPCEQFEPLTCTDCGCATGGDLGLWLFVAPLLGLSRRRK